MLDSFSPWQQQAAAGPSPPGELPASACAEATAALRGEPDFFEGNHGGGEIYPRSGMREHAAQSLVYIASAAQVLALAAPRSSSPALLHCPTLLP